MSEGAMHFMDQEEEPEVGKMKDESITINIVLDCFGGGGGKGWRPMMDDKHKMSDTVGCATPQPCGEPDWKQIAQQLMQAISMLDTETDAGMEGDMDPKAALQAADNMTSRLLWGKQDESNPMSMYQNANYLEHTANGFMMDNPAVSFNQAAYGEKADPDLDGDVDFGKKGVGDTDDDRDEMKPKGFARAGKDMAKKLKGGMDDEDEKDGPPWT